ncbi:MAG: response regulator transcription factor [Spirochaetaceae bacterium]|nr:response regulator transcription factor [Spirochaetaceae bacterium]
MKILVAEDDNYTRMGLEEIFQSEGYGTISTDNGQSAYELYLKEKPDLLCLDIMMPLMNGYDLCRKIRKSGDSTPVIFISAKSEEIDKVVGLELGADDYIIKPFGVREVLARVRAVMRRSPKEFTPDKERFFFGPIEIDTVSLSGKIQDKTIEFSPREMRIISFFHKNRGKVLSRDQLYDCGWGQDYLPSSRSLDQFISQLRKKIEPDLSAPSLIITVPTAGYRHPS